jgi:transcriptional regulator with XRE-family HTH domain
MLSKFGQIVRALRLAHGSMLMSEMAERLGVSPSYLSAVEFGRRAVPESWPGRIAEILSVSAADRALLDHAATTATSSVKGFITVPLEGLTELQEEVALQFANRIRELTDDELEAIKQRLLEGKTGEQRWRHSPT